jgi:LPXTG-motif cell wall-anchored protein
MTTRSGRFALLASTTFAVTLASAGLGAVPARAATAPIGLGTSASYAVIGGSTVTNTGPSVISGDVGLSPGSAVTGFPPGLVNDGVIHVTDAQAAQAQLDVTTAYDDAAGRPTTAVITADLGGMTLTDGVYTGPTLGLTGALTLDAQGDSSAVFVFQAASTLITASASSVVLVNGADPCNVYWQVGSSATIGTGSQFVGTVLALTAVSAQTGATVVGRLFARNAAVTVDTNTITRPVCASAAPTTTIAATTPTSGGGGATTAPGDGVTSLPAATVPPVGADSSIPPPAGTLPRTGASTAPATTVALLALAAGLGALVVVRRRPATD